MTRQHKQAHSVKLQQTELSHRGMTRKTGQRIGMDIRDATFYDQNHKWYSTYHFHVFQNHIRNSQPCSVDRPQDVSGIMQTM